MAMKGKKCGCGGPIGSCGCGGYSNKLPRYQQGGNPLNQMGQQWASNVPQMPTYSPSVPQIPTYSPNQQQLNNMATMGSYGASMMNPLQGPAGAASNYAQNNIDDSTTAGQIGMTAAKAAMPFTGVPDAADYATNQTGFGGTMAGKFLNPNGTTGKNAARWALNPAGAISQGLQANINDDTTAGKWAMAAAKSLNPFVGVPQAIKYGANQLGIGGGGPKALAEQHQANMAQGLAAQNQQATTADSSANMTQQSMYAPRSEYQYGMGGGLPSYQGGGYNTSSGTYQTSQTPGAYGKIAGASDVVAGAINPLAGLTAGAATAAGKLGGQKRPGIGNQITSWLQPWKRTAAHLDTARQYEKGSKERRGANLRALGTLLGGSVGSSIIDARDARIAKKAGDQTVTPNPAAPTAELPAAGPMAFTGPQYGGYSFGTYDPQGQASRSYGFTNQAYAYGGAIKSYQDGGGLSMASDNTIVDTPRLPEGESYDLTGGKDMYETFQEDLKKARQEYYQYPPNRNYNRDKEILAKVKKEFIDKYFDGDKTAYNSYDADKMFNAYNTGTLPSKQVGGELPSFTGGGGTDWTKIIKAGAELTPIVVGAANSLQQDQQTQNIAPQQNVGMSGIDPNMMKYMMSMANYNSMPNKGMPNYYSNYGMGPEGGYRPKQEKFFYQDGGALNPGKTPPGVLSTMNPETFNNFKYYESKDPGKTPSEILNIMNPETFNVSDSTRDANARLIELYESMDHGFMTPGWKPTLAEWNKMDKETKAVYKKPKK